MKYLIDFYNDSTESVIQSYLADNAITVISEFGAFEKCYLVECATLPPMVEGLIERLVEDNHHSFNLHNYPIPSGDDFPELLVDTNDEKNWWKISTFNQPDLNLLVQDYERRGNTATIYLVDSGVNISHSEFQHATIEQLYSFNGDHQDYLGHGTALASLMVGNTCGVTDAKVKCLKIQQDGVNTSTSDIVAAFNAIINDISANSPTFPIINLSWAITPNDYIEAKIKSLITAGVTIVCSAGNSGTEIENVTPTRIPGVIVVGSYNHDLQPSTFSNYTGPAAAISVWAPGENLAVAQGSTNVVTKILGTSAAAAIMTSIIAYNSNALVLTNGTVPESIYQYNIELLASSARPNLLTFNAPYDTSARLVGTIFAEYDGQNGANYATVSGFNILAASGDSVAKLVAPFYVVDTFIIDQPLPQGFHMDNGWIIGTMEVTEPFYWESLVTYTKHSGYVMHSMMRISILPTDMTIDQAPFDDSIKVNFQACTLLGTAGTYHCGGTCGAGVCTNACSGADKFNPSDFFCYCNPPSELCP